MLGVQVVNIGGESETRFFNDGIDVTGDGAYYKKEFPELEVDKSIVGIKFESEEVIYDFTLNNMIASKKDILRQEVSKILFD